jgi:hypothetical protein
MHEAGRQLIVTMVVTAQLLTACAWVNRQARPDWVDGRSRAYPADQYLLGVGEAASRSVAEERAYAAVSRIFSARVEAESHDRESFQVLEAKGRVDTARWLKVDQSTKVSTEKILEHVRVLDAWRDPATGRHHVLAGLDRAQAQATLTERLAELDRAIEADMAQARQAGEVLATIRALYRALKQVLLREAYNADLRVIRVSGQGIPSPYRAAELTSALKEYMAQHLLVTVEMQGDAVEEVQRALTEGLIREGLPVMAHSAALKPAPSGRDGGQLELLIRGTVRLIETDLPDPQFRYTRWCSDFVILDLRGQQLIGAISRGGREGHVTQAEATAKALRMLKQEVGSNLAHTLAQYVYGETEQAVKLPPAACPQGSGENQG